MRVQSSAIPKPGGGDRRGALRLEARKRGGDPEAGSSQFWEGNQERLSKGGRAGRWAKEASAGGAGGGAPVAHSFFLGLDKVLQKRTLHLLRVGRGNAS